MNIKNTLTNLFKNIKNMIENLFNEKKVDNTVSYNELRIRRSIKTFKSHFERICKENKINFPELTEDIIEFVITKFFNFTNYSDAIIYINNFLPDYVSEPKGEVNWNLPNEQLHMTKEYIDWRNYQDLKSTIYTCIHLSNLGEVWVDIYGKTHSDEEAAEIAANKWGELLFNFHLQDNGALDEETSFRCSLIATALGEKARENITDEMKTKTISLIKDFYLHYIHYLNERNNEDLNWCQNNLPHPKGKFNWDVMVYPYCDYDPNYPLYLILLNAGIPENRIYNICPWKTGIDIRAIDNTVLLFTYQNITNL